MKNEFLKSVIHHLPNALLYCKTLRNKDGKPYDFHVMHFNPAFENACTVEKKIRKGDKLKAICSDSLNVDIVWMLKLAGEIQENELREVQNYCHLMQRWNRIRVYCPENDHLIFIFADLTVEKVLQQQKRQAEKFYKAIVEIISSPHYAEGNIYEFINLLTEKAARVMEVAQAGVWFFDEDGEKLRCFDNYDAIKNKHTSGEVLSGVQYYSEINYLKKARYIDAHDALNDKRVEGYVNGYLIPKGITSMLDVGIKTEGDFKGVLCIEHIGEKRIWNHDEISFACQLADQVAIIMQIFHKKVTQNQLARSEEKLKSIFRAAPVGMGLLKNRVFVEVNDYLCRMTGYTPEELIGVNARILYPDDNEYERVGAEKYNQIKHTGLGTIETLWKTKSGEILQVLLSSSPLYKEDISLGVTFTALNISDPTADRTTGKKTKNTEKK
ncbi:MAG: PAS domain S-box protein [Bacteroidetes bacterium]|nr:MAG: PAS domain S-box protein [Bacteroidota bacterium]